MIVKCVTCGEEFYCKPSRYNKGYGRYCSFKCSGKALTGSNNPNYKGGDVKKICEICGKDFFVKRNKKANSKTRFCGKPCADKYHSITHIKEKHSQWKGGKETRICVICGNKFEAFKCRVIKGKANFCSHSCNAINNVLNGNKSNTGIEKKIAAELTNLKIKFIHQYRVPNTRIIPDFFIEPNIVIFADGDYWHNLKKQISKDLQQNFVLKFLGYNIYRFWEHEINKNVAECISRIKEISK